MKTDTARPADPRRLPSPLGDAVPRDCLVFSCAEAIDGAEASFGGAQALFDAMRTRISSRTRTVALIYPAFTYTRPAPRFLGGPDDGAIEQIRRVYDAIEQQTRPSAASILCQSTEIRLNGDVLHYHEDGQLRILYETCRLTECHSIEGERVYAETADERLPEQGIYLYLASVGSHNYGHWLTDDLPRLRAFFLLCQRYPNRTITIVTPSYNVTIDEVRLRTIRLYLGCDADWHLIFLKRDRVYAFAQLYHVTPCSQQPIAKSPAAITSMRTRLLRNTRPARTRAAFRRLKAAPLDLIRRAGRRIFVDRQTFRGRAIINRDEILTILGQRGFDIVDPETMSPGEQIDCFARADFVVGIMGAAMTNTIFCPRGTRVLHVAPDADWSDPFFWDLAAVCGHRYAAVYGAWAPSEEPRRLRNFTVSSRDFIEALDAV